MAAAKYATELKKAKSLREVVACLLEKGVKETAMPAAVLGLRAELPLLKGQPEHTLAAEVARVLVSLRAAAARRAPKRPARPITKARPKPRAAPAAASPAPRATGSKLDQIRAQREALAAQREAAAKKKR